MGAIFSLLKFLKGHTVMDIFIDKEGHLGPNPRDLLFALLYIINTSVVYHIKDRLYCLIVNFLFSIHSVRENQRFGTGP